MKKINVANYQSDKLFPRVVKAVSEILATSHVVAPVDVLMRMQLLNKQQYEDWRFGRVPYLERVCQANLGRLNRVLRILDRHSRSLGLKPSQTAYRKWGRGGKRIELRFSKSGEAALEGRLFAALRCDRAGAGSRRIGVRAKPPSPRAPVGDLDLCRRWSNGYRHENERSLSGAAMGLRRTTAKRKWDYARTWLDEAPAERARKRRRNQKRAENV